MSLLLTADLQSVTIAQYFRSFRREMRSASYWSLFLGLLTFLISFALSDFLRAFVVGAVIGALLFLAGAGLLVKRSPAMLRAVALLEGAAGLWQLAATYIVYTSTGGLRGGAIVLGIILLLRARNHLKGVGPFAEIAGQVDMEVVRQLDELCSAIIKAKPAHSADIVEFTTGGFFSRAGWRAARLPEHIVFLKFADGYNLGRKAEGDLVIAVRSAVAIEPVGDSAFGSKVRLLVRIGEDELRDVTMAREAFEKFQFWTSGTASFSTVASQV